MTYRKLSETAPFREYKKTDEEVYEDGLQSGLEWPAEWNHFPGGPYCSKWDKNDDPDWIAYCQLQQHHHKVWLDAWHEGFRRAALVDPRIEKLRTDLFLKIIADA